jgi:hypothetical protein
MVVSPLLRGMMGLEVDASAKQVRFAPHLPADWTSAGIDNVRVGGSTLHFAYAKSTDGVTLRVSTTGPACTVEFSPALSLRAKILGAEINGKPLPVRDEVNGQDQHASIEFRTASQPQTLKIRAQHDFGLAVSSELPSLGNPSSGIRVTSERWSSSRDTLTLEISGASGRAYTLAIWNAGEIGAVEGGELFRDPQGRSGLRVAIPEATDPYGHVQVVIHFALDGRSPGRH